MALERYSVDYQGIRGTGEFSFARSPGLSPDKGYIILPLSGLPGEGQVKIVARLGVQWQNVIPSGSTALPPDGGNINFGAILGLQPSGTLRAALGAGGINITDVYIDNDAIQGITPDSAHVRVGLSDIRMFWQDHGWVFGDYNLVAEYGAANDVTTIKGVGYVTSSLNGGALWTLWQIISEVLVPALPGKLQSRGGSQLEINKIIPLNLRYRFERPAKALGDLLDRFRLIFAFSYDSSYALWFDGQGDPPITSKGQWAEVTEAQGLTYRPPAVKVVGAPIQRNVLSHGWIPVCKDVNGEIVPLEKIAERWGYNREVVINYGRNWNPNQFVLTDPLARMKLAVCRPPQERFRDIFDGNPAVREAKIRLAEECVFKWYMLPDAIFGRRRNYLPMLPDVAGYATVFDEPEGEDGGGGGGIGVGGVLNKGPAPGGPLGVGGDGGGGGGGGGGSPVTRKPIAVVATRFVQLADRLEGERILVDARAYTEGELATATAALMEGREALEEAFAKIDAGVPKTITPDAPPSVRVWKNVPPDIIDPGLYTIDTKLGLLQFKEVMGHLGWFRPAHNLPSIGAFLSIEESWLEFPAIPSVLFAHEPYSNTPEDYYQATYVGEAGGIIKVNEASPPEGVVVEGRPDLILYIAHDGVEMNRKQLDAEAESIAKTKMMIPQVVESAQVKLRGIHAFGPDGIVTRVVWHSDGDLGFTELLYSDHTSEIEGHPSSRRKTWTKRMMDLVDDQRVLVDVQKGK